MNTQSITHIESAIETPALDSRALSLVPDPAFLALADEFGMVPERMAERVLSAYAATRPSLLLVTGRKSAVPSSR